MVPQPINQILVITCQKCGGTGFKIGKKGKRKVCKLCNGVPNMGNNQMVVNHPNYHIRRTWCFCCKVSKKGYRKCKCAKGCMIF